MMTVRRSNTRDAITLIATVAGLISCAYLVVRAAGQFRSGPELLALLDVGVLTIMTAACSLLALRGMLKEVRSQPAFAIVCGLLTGVIGFAAGFFGPILLAADVSYEPIFGIFISGPLGFALGMAAGYHAARFRPRH
jgi:hypothetical protein